MLVDGLLHSKCNFYSGIEFCCELILNHFIDHNHGNKTYRYVFCLLLLFKNGIWFTLSDKFQKISYKCMLHAHFNFRILIAVEHVDRLTTYECIYVVHKNTYRYELDLNARWRIQTQIIHCSCNSRFI